MDVVVFARSGQEQIQAEFNSEPNKEEREKFSFFSYGAVFVAKAEMFAVDRSGERQVARRRKTAQSRSKSSKSKQRLQIPADICGRNGKQRKRPEKFPREMTGTPKSECADGCNENVKDKCSRPNDRRCQPKQSHRGDVTRSTGVAD